MKNYSDGMPKKDIVEIFGIGIDTLNRWTEIPQYVTKIFQLGFWWRRLGKLFFKNKTLRESRDCPHEPDREPGTTDKIY